MALSGAEVTAHDPVMHQLARHEREQDAAALREDRIADRAHEIAVALLLREPDEVCDAVYDDPMREAEWASWMRQLAFSAVQETHYKRSCIANQLAELLWQTAREMGQQQAEEE